MPPLLWPMTTGSWKPRSATQRAAMRFVFDRFACFLESSPFGHPAVTDAEDVVAAAVEGEAGIAQFRQRGRQEARRADVEVHGVAVKQQRRAGRGAALGLVPDAVQRYRVGRDGD